ncbi:MAG: hypothetical protein RJA22_1244 [Verrucomicrobiota bacterium]
MSRTLSVRRRPRTRPLDTRLLRRVALWALHDALGLQHYELGIHLVGATTMARINETYLGHPGSTDVITFDHGPGPGPGARPHSAPMLQGEIFICLDDAVAQARRFRTTWTEEVVRYLLHGLLHLRGFDDLAPAARRVMKREENRLVRAAARAFPLQRLARPARRP